MDNTKSNARELMTNAVFDILIKDSYTEISIDDIFKNTKLEVKDKALITAVVNETVKMKMAIDALISKYSKIPINKLDPFVLSALRVATAQLRYFDRVPSHAIVDETVKIAKKRRSYASGFTNAVLRKIAANNDIKFDKYTQASYEPWMVKRWEEAYGKEFAKNLMDAGNEVTGTSIRINTLKTEKNKVISEIEEIGYKIVKEFEDTSVIVLEKAPGIANSDMYKNGHITFQDEAAARVCIFLEPKENEKVLDMCAAPGGKTFYIAQLMNNKGNIIARDHFDWKMEAMADESNRLGVKNTQLQTVDALYDNINDHESYDKILADVPCMGTGIIRKKPEIKWNRKIEDIKTLNEIQKKILSNAFKYLKPGGTLVYSTCSLEIEENDIIVNEFIENNSNASLVKYTNESNFLKLYPNVDGTDGFFAAKIMKER